MLKLSILNLERSILALSAQVGKVKVGWLPKGEQEIWIRPKPVLPEPNWIETDNQI